MRTAGFPEADIFLGGPVPHKWNLVVCYHGTVARKPLLAHTDIEGGHSSVPLADNAIYHLAQSLTKVAHFGFPIKTNEVTKNYFLQLAKTETGTS